MFRKNDDHSQHILFNDVYSLKPSVAKLLSQSWAPIFYKQVFCKINEDSFAPLYCSDNGRPNFPVNILLSLEIIKNLFDYTDVEIVEQFHFNLQVMHALGINNIGEISLAPRTIYDFRERVFNYIKAHPDQEDILFQQFESLTDNFIQVPGLKTDQQRIDSTLISPNIKKAGRLSLAHDVLAQAVQDLPEQILSGSLKQVLESSFRNNLLYHTRNRELDSRLQMVLDLMAEIETLSQQHPDLTGLESLDILKRFLSEQAVYNEEEGRYLPRDKKEIASSSLQSAYDSDATFRAKAGKRYSGYGLQLSETCSEENPVQMITDYYLAPNNKSDVEIGRQRLTTIKESTDVKDIVVDGGYYSPEVIEEAKKLDIDLYYTNMTGKEAAPGKIPVSKFTINEQMEIIQCPAGHEATRSNYNEKKKTLSAHFAAEDCQTCELRPNCPVKPQKNDFVVRTSQKSLQAATVREQINNRETNRQNTSLRAGIEGTNSSLKRAQGIGKLRTRGLIRSGMEVAFKIIGHNFKQLWRAATGKFRPKYKKQLKGQLCPITG